jgi:hypothetical protein
LVLSYDAGIKSFTNALQIHQCPTEAVQLELSSPVRSKLVAEVPYFEPPFQPTFVWQSLPVRKVLVVTQLHILQLPVSCSHALHLSSQQLIQCWQRSQQLAFCNPRLACEGPGVFSQRSSCTVLRYGTIAHGTVRSLKSAFTAQPFLSPGLRRAKDCHRGFKSLAREQQLQE